MGQSVEVSEHHDSRFLRSHPLFSLERARKSTTGSQNSTAHTHHQKVKGTECRNHLHRPNSLALTENRYLMRYWDHQKEDELRTLPHQLESLFSFKEAWGLGTVFFAAFAKLAQMAYCHYFHNYWDAVSLYSNGWTLHSFDAISEAAQSPDSVDCAKDSLETMFTQFQPFFP